MRPAIIAACCFVAGILLKLSVGCGKTTPAEVVEATNAVVVDGSECLYAAHRSRVLRCATDEPTEEEARECIYAAEQAFEPLAQALEVYRCAIGGECSVGP